ncbi:MAG: MCE family protein [Actinobacteria bacterium]|nr:MCE family protein [Actinomycetota bacterium]
MSGQHPLLKFVIFAAVCVAFAAWLVVTIGNIRPFADRVTYEAAFGDVTGLVTNDAVKVAGVEVGKVDDIRIERGEAVVTFSLGDDIRLGRDTTVAVRWRNLLGLRYLYVYPAGDGELQPGHRFPTERTLAVADFGRLMERLVPIQRALEPEVGNVVVRALNDAVGGREQQIQELIAEAASLTTTVAARDEQIGRILRNGAVLAGEYARREQALRSFLRDFADVSETVAGRNDELIRIVRDLADAQEALRTFVEDNRAAIHGTIDELDELTAILSVNHTNLEDLVTHLGRGLAFYHRTSRWGQWFNIRVAGFSDGGEVVSTERGACLPAPVPPEEQPPNMGRNDECSGSGVVLDEEEERPASGGRSGGVEPLFRAGLRQPLRAATSSAGTD